MATQAVNGKIWADAGRGAILPMATLMLVALMIVPIPSVLLDVGFIANIMISLAVLMVALNAPSRSISPPSPPSSSSPPCSAWRSTSPRRGWCW
jgi:flagellar biosynthesis component FlhA